MPHHAWLRAGFVSVSLFEMTNVDTMRKQINAVLKTIVNSKLLSYASQLHRIINIVIFLIE